MGSKGVKTASEEEMNLLNYYFFRIIDKRIFFEGDNPHC